MAQQLVVVIVLFGAILTRLMGDTETLLETSMQMEDAGIGRGRTQQYRVRR
jgi:hypothetical protein